MDNRREKTEARHHCRGIDSEERFSTTTSNTTFRWTYIISLKYSPVHCTLSRAFGESLQAAGRSVRYLYSSAYLWMEENEQTNIDYVLRSSSLTEIILDTLGFFFGGCLRFWRIFRHNPPENLIFMSSHPLNFAVSMIARWVNPDIHITNLLHEPYKKEKLVYGVPKAMYIWILELVQSVAIRVADEVIVPSETAARAFWQRYPWFERSVKVVPLLFEDKACSIDLPRRYVSFLGHAVKVKGVELFFELVEESTRRGLDFNFQIVTSSDISQHLTSLSRSARSNLRVVSSTWLSDEEISFAARESAIFLALYETVMQSGVIPVAFMNGTPVIATDLDGLTEFVRHKYNGWIVPVNPSYDQVFNAIFQIFDHLETMVSNCRHTYETTFDKRNLRSYVDWL